jgi:hypothetical protein
VGGKSGSEGGRRGKEVRVWRKERETSEEGRERGKGRGKGRGGAKNEISGLRKLSRSPPTVTGAA